MMVEDLREKQYQRIRKKVRRGRVCRLTIGAVLFAALYCAAFWGQSDFEVSYYQIFSDKVNEPFRTIVLSDLHSCEYGTDNEELIEQIKVVEPDMILMLGDMLNMDNPDVPRLLELCENLLTTAPVYYINGNHENKIMNTGPSPIPLNDMLRENGVLVLTNAYEDVTVGDTAIRIIGITSNQYNFDEWSKTVVDQAVKTDSFKILMSHYPSLYYEKLKDLDVDLALAGHYHGGQIRIPGTGGVYHPDVGFFPQYDGGRYQLSHADLIVSRGIGSYAFVPRVNNWPELVIIDVMSDAGTE